MTQGKLPKYCDIRVDSSAFPEVKREMIEIALLSRNIPSCLLYSSDSQAQKWLDIHFQYSPVHKGNSAKNVYLESFQELNKIQKGKHYDLYSFGSGGGNKEALFLEANTNLPKQTHVIDCSPFLAIHSWQETRAFAEVKAHVADIEVMANLPNLEGHYFSGIGIGSKPALIFFMGMLPNIPPKIAWHFLKSITRKGDILTIGANLASPQEIESKLPNIILQYDNEPTRAWIAAFTENLGLMGLNKEFAFETANFSFCDYPLAMVRTTLEVKRLLHPRSPGVPPIQWCPGSCLDIFRSVRYSPESLINIAKINGFNEVSCFVDGSCQEGVFILERC